MSALTSFCFTFTSGVQCCSSDISNPKPPLSSVAVPLCSVAVPLCSVVFRGCHGSLFVLVSRPRPADLPTLVVETARWLEVSPSLSGPGHFVFGHEPLPKPKTWKARQRKLNATLPISKRQVQTCFFEGTNPVELPSGTRRNTLRQTDTTNAEH